ncbi:MAG: GNAT family N-acetyltransferase [Pikeienuella sp.]
MSTPNIRQATQEDLAGIVALLVDDDIGRLRESTDGVLDPGYQAAFAAMQSDPNCTLVVGESAGRIVATYQLNFIPGLSHKGGWRGQIESVRVAKDLRGSGIGTFVIQSAIDACRARGCHLVQLAADNTRNDAHRFYERLGFQPSHIGFKLKL